MSTSSADPAKLQGLRQRRKAPPARGPRPAIAVAAAVGEHDRRLRRLRHGSPPRRARQLLDAMGENEHSCRRCAPNCSPPTITTAGRSRCPTPRWRRRWRPRASARRRPVSFEPITIVGIPQTSGFVDDPICAANGNMVHQDIDLVFPGVASTLAVDRTYNSVPHGA